MKEDRSSDRFRLKQTSQLKNIGKEIYGKILSHETFSGGKRVWVTLRREKCWCFLMVGDKLNLCNNTYNSKN